MMQRHKAVGKNPFSIDLSNQSQGIYFVEIRQAENIWRSKVVKE